PASARTHRRLLRYPLLQAVRAARRGPVGTGRTALRSQPAENITLVIGTHPLGPCRRNEVPKRAILRVTNSDARLPSCITRHVANFGSRDAEFRRAEARVTRLRIGDDERVVFEDGDAARPAKVAPFVYEIHVLIED